MFFLTETFTFTCQKFSSSRGSFKYSYFSLKHSLYSGVGQPGVPAGLITLRSVETGEGTVAEFKSTPRYFISSYFFILAKCLGFKNPNSLFQIFKLVFPLSSILFIIVYPNCTRKSLTL